MRRRSARKRSWSWRSRPSAASSTRSLAVLLVGLAVWYLAHNTLENMRARGIQSGFDFLGQPAGFDIGESLIPYDALDPYWKAFLVGILNTLRVAIIGIVLATILGTLLGIGPLLAQRHRARPLLRVRRALPQHPGAAAAPDVVPALHRHPAAGHRADPVAGLFFLSKAGFSFPFPRGGRRSLVALGELARHRGRVALLALGDEAVRAHRPRAQPVLGADRFLVVGGVAGWLAGGAPTQWSVPVPGAFTMEGGASATPEFLARAAGARALHRGLHRRGGARRHRVGVPRAGRGGGEASGSRAGTRCGW